MKEGLSPAAVLLTVTVLVISFLAGGYIIRHPFSRAVVFLPTSTAIPPTPTFTPTASPTPTGTVASTETPTITSTPLPTDTPKPPRFHTVASSETLFGLGLFYGITANSIAEANGLPPGSGIQVAQSLVIPWPTATPPLVPIEVEVAGQTIIADPTDCEFYQIQGGDTLFGIASRSGVDLRAILAVNRLNDQVVLQPGDVLCIPKIIRNGVLPPTPGPSATPTQTPPPQGPQLLYPIQDAVVEPPEGPLVLQWAAVKDLAPNEWYMVELTNLSLPDSHPWRGFTRQTAFRVPSSWRPTVVETHLFRWRVSIIQVTGERDDGSFIYTFGGNSSTPDFFSWLGHIPTPTPTATSSLPTPYPTPTEGTDQPVE
jgi:LysM repeat protein